MDIWRDKSKNSTGYQRITRFCARAAILFVLGSAILFGCVALHNLYEFVSYTPPQDFYKGVSHVLLRYQIRGYLGCSVISFTLCWLTFGLWKLRLWAWFISLTVVLGLLIQCAISFLQFHWFRWEWHLTVLSLMLLLLLIAHPAYSSHPKRQ